jgi:ubiquinone/menaquinone biosynthesis C-methylase UbiE
MHFLHTRRREAEWIDEPGADPVQLRKSLAYIRRVNRVMGYTRVVLRQLDRFSARWDRSKVVTILDIGTGSADIPLAILRWADRRGFNVRIVAIDLNPQIVLEAAAAVRDPRLTILRADALCVPFADGSFDYAITSMFLHHLDDADARQALSEMGRVAKRGIIASDLLRHRSAYAFIWLFTTLSNPMVKHDARVSVAQSFNREEILGLRDGAGVGFAEYSVHYMHRFVLAGEKSGRS